MPGGGRGAQVRQADEARGSRAVAARRAIVWGAPTQQELLRAVVAQAGLTVVASGSPGGPPDAGPFGGERILDLRRALSSVEADVALLASSDAGAGPSPLDEPSTLRAAAERAVRLVTLEPAPASIQTLATHLRSVGAAGATGALEPDAGLRDDAEPARFVPLTRRSRGFRAATEALERLGSARTVMISHRGGVADGSLAAQLFDAMDLVHALLGEPEAIDAANAGPGAPGGVHLAPGERLRDLRGDLTANLRFGSGRIASLTLSDAAGRWFRGATIIGAGGALRLDDKSFEFIDTSGASVDRSRSRLSSGAPGDPGAAAAIAEQIEALFDPRTPRPAPIPMLRVLAMCEAALLSARTGQPESPATILRMAGVM